jgi:hypothetical protein
LGKWWASTPKSRWPNNPQVTDYVSRLWEDPFGDRRQEIVFIGTGIDWPLLKSRLDDCLIEEDKGDDLAAFAAMDDPFPAWKMREQSA